MLWREPMWGPMCLVFSLRPTWQSNWLATAAGRTAKWLEVRSGPRKSCVLLVSWTRVYKSWCCNHELTTLVVHDIVSTIKSDVNMVARRRLLLASVIGRVSKQMIIYPRSTFTHDFPYFRWKARVMTIICFVFGCNHNSYTDNKPKLNRKSEFFIIINNK